MALGGSYATVVLCVRGGGWLWVWVDFGGDLVCRALGCPTHGRRVREIQGQRM